MKQRMSGTITVRLSRRSLKLLKQRASRRGQSASETLRELIEAQLEPWPKGVSAWDLTRQWVGSISSKRVPHGANAREAMQDWNPDRR